MSFPVSITLQVHVHSDSNTDKQGEKLWKERKTALSVLENLLYN